MKTNKNLIRFGLAAMLLAPAMVSCLSDGEETIILEDGQPKSTIGIPLDEVATQNPTITDPTIILPNPSSVELDREKNEYYATVAMTGIWDADNDCWLRLYGTGDKNQNVWLSVDDEPKGIDVYNIIDDNKGYKMVNDVVFLIDCSPSMEEEADAIANSVMSWAQSLAEQNIDLRIGCVGYGGTNHAISGALNLTTPTLFRDYITKYEGTERTKYFGGADADELENMAWGSDKFENGSFNECGVLALCYATNVFNFRKGANRIFINFTDEANQPNGDEKWSVERLNPTKGWWKSANGTVHTVFSNEKVEYDKPLIEENPWLMSEYTGGTVIYTDPSFKGFTLDNLPVTGAMKNGYLIRFGNIEKYFDENYHKVKISVLTPDGRIRTQKVFNHLFRPE